jgi:hypothetical protein
VGAEHKKTPTRRWSSATDRGAIAVRLNDCRYFDIRIAEEKILVNRLKAQRSDTHKISPQVPVAAGSFKRTNFAAFAKRDSQRQNSLFFLKRMTNFLPSQAIIGPLKKEKQYNISHQEMT